MRNVGLTLCLNFCARARTRARARARTRTHVPEQVRRVYGDGELFLFNFFLAHTHTPEQVRRVYELAYAKEDKLLTTRVYCVPGTVRRARASDATPAARPSAASRVRVFLFVVPRV